MSPGEAATKLKREIGELMMQKEATTAVKTTPSTQTHGGDAPAQDSSADAKAAEPSKTLRQVLAQFGIEKALASEEKPSEVQRLRYLRRILPPLMELCKEARVAEKFISRSVVLGTVGCGRNTHERVQSELAQAQRAYGLQGARASRATTWQEYAKLVAGAANAVHEDVSMPSILEFRPSFIKAGPEAGTGAGARSHQVLALKRHALAMVELAITEVVYRGAASLKKNGSKVSKAKPCASALPAHLCVAVQVCVLKARSVQTSAAEDCRTWTATACSEGLVLDPHAVSATEPLILFEVNPKYYKIRTDEVQLRISVANSVLAGAAAAEKDLVAAAAAAGAPGLQCNLRYVYVTKPGMIFEF